MPTPHNPPRMYERQNFDRWFYLSFHQRQQSSLVIGIFKPVAQNFSKYLAKSRYIKRYQDEFNLDIFESDPMKAFGFDSSLKYIGERDNYIVQHALLTPNTNVTTLAISLSIIMTQLRWFPESNHETFIADNQQRQLFVFESSVSRNPYNSAPIYGTALPVVMCEMKKIAETCGQRDRIYAIEDAMKDAGNAIVPSGSPHRVEFRTDIPRPYTYLAHAIGDGSQFSIQSHGASVGTYSTRFQEDQGGEIVSHNIDSVTDQIIIYAGLAALHDLVDQRLRPLT